jgi:hypothetical protein
MRVFPQPYTREKPNAKINSEIMNLLWLKSGEDDGKRDVRRAA